jgi:hypothetical protein
MQVEMYMMCAKKKKWEGGESNKEKTEIKITKRNQNDEYY